jgi:hypothetical protein
VTAQPPWKIENGRPMPANIIEAISSEWWWGEWFRRGNWNAWHSFLAALFALPMTEQQLALYHEHTGRAQAPAIQAREAWAVCGRRAGKTRIMSTVAAWLACFVDWRPYLAPGERATIQLISGDRRQCRVALRYLRSLIVQHPLLKQLVQREGAEEIVLNCGTVIEVTTASFRSTRGYSVAAILADEVAFWRDEEGGANPAQEIFTALRPAMATLPRSLLMVATTPYARKGIVYATWKRHWGQDGDPILVWRAPTRAMNATVSQAVVNEALELDPSSGASEFLAEFRSDIETYISPQVVDGCTVPGRFELLPRTGVQFVGAIDPSGGSSDSMTLAIAYYDRAAKCAVLAAVRERRPPFSPDDCVIEFSALLKSYGVHRVVGDRYAGEWPRERFKVHGITYEPSAKSKSDAYAELLPLLNAGRVELLDHRKLLAQLIGLERRTARGGRDSIDHPRGAHDDLINSAALALVACAEGSGRRMMITPAILANASRPSVRAAMFQPRNTSHAW